MGLVESKLFAGITEEEIERMRVCFGITDRVGEIGEIVYDYALDAEKVGVIIDGSVFVQKISEDGELTMIEHLKEGDVFGGMLMFENAGDENISVVCETPCYISYIRADQITKRCENACPFHSLLVENMFHLVARKAKTLSERLEVLSRHSIREKLMRFFALNTDDNGEMTLPFTLAALADYISADRSAMMREIKRMRNENLIYLKGKKVKLLALSDN